MSTSSRKFSIHPKLAALFDLLINLTTFFWFPFISWLYSTYLQNWFIPEKFDSRLVVACVFAAFFLIRYALWAFFVRSVYYPPEFSRPRHWWSLIFFNLGLVASMSIFIDWLPAWYLLISIFIIFSALSFWLLPAHDSSLSLYQKPFRRWLFLMDSFGLAGLWCGIFAFVAFQLLSFAQGNILYLLGAIVSTIISFWWWRAYKIEYSRRFWISLAAMFIIILELAWVIARLSVGYMIAGIMIIWLWYAAWLIMRFNLSPEGMDWKKQRFFLIMNVILFTLFIFLAKWN